MTGPKTIPDALFLQISAVFSQVNKFRSALSGCVTCETQKTDNWLHHVLTVHVNTGIAPLSSTVAQLRGRHASDGGFSDKRRGLFNMNEL